MAKREAIGGGRIIDAMDRLAVETFVGEPFLYVPNKDRKSEIVNAAPGVRTLSTVSHGLNAYQDYHNIYISAALNREPKQYKMMQDLGLAPETVHKSTFGEAVYQAVMRTSLRNPEATEPVRVIVPDLFCVRYLGRVLGGLDPRPLGPIIAPRKRALTQTERSRRCRLANTKRRLFCPPESTKPLL